MLRKNLLLTFQIRSEHPRVNRLFYSLTPQDRRSTPAKPELTASSPGPLQLLKPSCVIVKIRSSVDTMLAQPGSSRMAAKSQENVWPVSTPLIPNPFHGYC